MYWASDCVLAVSCIHVKSFPFLLRKVRFCSFIIFCAAFILMSWQIYINSEVISSLLFFILSRWVVFLYLQLIKFCSCVIYAMKYWSLVRYKLNVQNHMQIVLLDSTCPIKPILSFGVQFICFVLWSPDLLKTQSFHPYQHPSFEFWFYILFYFILLLFISLRWQR